jgi:ribosomal protein S18 acetylase RimI-like enzyme
VNIRPVTEADEAIVRPLWDEFELEVPSPRGFEESWEEAWADLARHAREGAAFLVEDDEGVFGYAFARKPERGRAHLTDLYVRPRARRQGHAKALIAAVAEAVRPLGADQLSLDVQPSNTAAMELYARLGFRELERLLAADLDPLGERLGERGTGPSYGSVHVQTDDVPAVERAVRQFVPRLPGRSQGTVIAQPRNGWIAVYDELCDREPAMLRRLARELSDRMGAVVLSFGVEDGAVVRYVLLEYGRVVDEYLSVPEFHGDLPPGDVVALAANPTAVARLTGTDPARVRAVARTATSPADLPPAPELLGEIADALGLEGADHGYGQARQISGAVVIAAG